MDKKIQKKAFTLSETIIVMAIVGVLVILYMVAIKLYNQTQKGFDIQAQKTLENIDQVFNLAFAKHSTSFDLNDLNDSQGNFSITDNDADARFIAFFKEYMNMIELRDINKEVAEAYFNSNIMDYNRKPTESKLKDTFSNFMTATNGTIFGFKLYKSCSAQEKNANPPLVRGRSTINNICGSIFFDVNNYDTPNKLGSDQYIIPFDSQGTEIKK